MDDDAVCYLSMQELHKAFVDRALSPTEVTEYYLSRIERLEPKLHTYVTVTGTTARREAAASERRFARAEAIGPLDGMPVGLKDLYDTAGVRTTGQSNLYRHRVPNRDAIVVRRLKEGGAVLLGKHAMHELAIGKPIEDGAFPPARNPWNSALTPGGSSSGSGAAVAAGLCAAAMGTDTGGSIRWPASACGIVGLKPTSGVVGRSGILPLSRTLDHAGPMTRTVCDAAILLQAVAGFDPLDSASSLMSIPDYMSGFEAGIAGVRIGAPLTFVEASADIHSEVLAAYRKALAALTRIGADVQPVELPETAHFATVSTTIMLSEMLAVHERDARERPELFGSGFYPRLLQAALIKGSDYVNAVRAATLIARGLERVMKLVDLIALPTMLQPAWSFGADPLIPGHTRTHFTAVFNVTGQPAISIRCGFTADGLPLGLQLVGRRFEDATVLAAAHAYERAHNWQQRRPRLDS